MNAIIKNIGSLYSTKLKYPSKYTPIIVLYVIIVILQVLYIKYITGRKEYTRLDKQVEYNNKHYAEISDFLREKLKERVQWLTSGKMNYREWVDYTSNNPAVTFEEGHKYNFFICERGTFKTPGDSEVFKIAGNQNENYVNVTWKDIYSDASDQFVFVKQSLDPSTLLRFFEFGKPDVINEITYYWVDYIEGELTPIVENSFYMIIPATKDHNTAVISVSMDMINLKTENKFYYDSVIQLPYIAILSLLSFIISVLLYVSSITNSKYISYVCIIVTNVYLAMFLTSAEYRGTAETETKKIKQINSGVLSVSFLVGVNTFIISYLTKNQHTDLFMQSAIIFSISIILLLSVLVKVTDYITITEMVENRLTSQMFFNFSLLLNIFVVATYIISILKKTK